MRVAERLADVKSAGLADFVLGDIDVRWQVCLLLKNGFDPLISYLVIRQIKVFYVVNTLQCLVDRFEIAVPQLVIADVDSKGLILPQLVHLEDLQLLRKLFVLVKAPDNPLDQRLEKFGRLRTLLPEVVLVFVEILKGLVGVLA